MPCEEATLLCATVPANLIRLAIGSWVLLSGYGALGLIITLVVTSLLKLGLLIMSIIRSDDLLQKISKLHWQAFLVNHSWKSHLAATTPFVLLDLAWIIELQIGNVLLSLWMDEEAVGIYGSAFALISMLLLISYAVMQTIFPVMARLRWESIEHLRLFYEKSCLYMLLIGMLVSAITTIVADELYRLLYPATFANGAHVLVILSWSMIFTYVHAPISRLMLVYTKQWGLALFITLGAILNICLNLWLIPKVGIEGAAWARLGSYSLFFIFNLIYVNQQIMNVNLVRISIVPVLIFACCQILMLLLKPYLGTWVIFVGVGFFCGLVWACKVVNLQDINALKHILAPSTSPT